MIPDELSESIVQFFKSQKDIFINILDFNPVAGGCINNGGILKTTEGSFFLKWNDKALVGTLFESEFKGLEYLISSSPLIVPRPITFGQTDNFVWIIMDRLESARSSVALSLDFGSKLAEQHKVSNDQYGLDYNNYIGRLEQSNKLANSWYEFFIMERLEPQLKLAVDEGLLGRDSIKALEGLSKALPDLIPVEKPALIHGDLWSGNYMFTSEGVAIFDPAIYYGHRESELSFTHMFGGFSEEFYSSYNEAWPLESGFEQRIEIHNLYPLLVHVNLFGGHYISQFKSKISYYLS